MSHSSRTSALASKIVLHLWLMRFFYLEPDFQLQRLNLHSCTTARKMLPSLIFSLAVASSVDLSLALVLEPVDFNVTQALIEQGVNVSAVPALAALTDQSSVFACSIAVRHAPC